jgi:molybdate transport system substrate-binding protein
LKRSVVSTLSILTLLTTLVFEWACRHPNNQRLQITVAAASDLTAAFEEIGREFEATQNIKVVFVFGSTGMLTRQIENGAPMDLFAAANVAYVNQLEQKGLIVPDTKAIYARGRITLWTTADSPLKVETVSDLTRPEIKRVAIANPDHAPYGLAAKQALESAGVWESVKPKLVYGDNIRQTLQYAETGNVDVSIVALSLSQQSKGRWTLVPEQLHQPIDQGLAVIKSTHNEQAARAFASFVTGPRGKEILGKYGFAFP